LQRKILITGASGYVGAYLCKKLSKWGTDIVTALYNTTAGNFPNINYVKCDITNLNRLTKIFNEAKPDVVYHLASVTPTRIGKRGNDYVEFFNHFITGHIAKLCQEHNSLLIYTSTDLVYGEGENITEDSMLNPKTIYAESKLNGEEVIESFAPKYVILRMSLVFGLTLNSYTTFFDLAYRSLRDGLEVKAFGDMYRHPIYVQDAVYNILKIPSVYDENLIMNFCGNEYLSRYDMSIQMAEAFSFNKNLITKISCDDIPGEAWVKRLNLNNQMMHFYQLFTNTFEDNLAKSLKYRY
jgi:dTDP-4-dehydrorhamnose reductase